MTRQGPAAHTVYVNPRNKDIFQSQAQEIVNSALKGQRDSVSSFSDSDSVLKGQSIEIFGSVFPLTDIAWFQLTCQKAILILSNIRSSKCSDINNSKNI
jgi:hypothetical protein